MDANARNGHQYRQMARQLILAGLGMRLLSADGQVRSSGAGYAVPGAVEIAGLQIGVVFGDWRRSWERAGTWDRDELHGVHPWHGTHGVLRSFQSSAITGALHVRHRLRCAGLLATGTDGTRKTPVCCTVARRTENTCAGSYKAGGVLRSTEDRMRGDSGRDREGSRRGGDSGAARGPLVRAHSRRASITERAELRISDIYKARRRRRWGFDGLSRCLSL